ncbi:IS3 family transposase [Paenibacillus polymyxa]|uniref:IS3 family transposase n=1 Tax=Paenibacillus polymyxa TaxID=1406 RepID=UPI003D64B32D
MESFHSTLKSETFYLEGLTCTRTAIEQTVRGYIFYYSSIRIQTKLNNQSPVHFRQLAALNLEGVLIPVSQTVISLKEYSFFNFSFK